MRFSRLPLLWRVFMINAALLVLGSVLLAVTPASVHSSIALVDAIELFSGVAVMLIANLLLLRPIVEPIDRLVRRMRTVDLLRPGQRLAGGGGLEVDALVDTFNQMVDRLEAERQESGRRALDAQESERLRIAQGLHDEVGQALTGVLLQLDALERSGAQAEAVQETKETLRQALDEVRRIAYELRPALLEHLGLVSALRELAARFGERAHVAVEQHFDTPLQPLLDAVELAVYRVAQESLTNVARHAQASHVRLSLVNGPRSVVLRVSDDGRGFDTSAEPGPGGIRGMRERAVLVGGALAVKSTPPHGTEVRLEVPALPG
jgi:two-component system sensor histidine kinase UhpB